MKGIFLGRVSPPHLGHSKIIDQMISECGIENSLVILGSAGSPISFRMLFPYADRRRWIKRLYRDIKIVPMPDCGSDAEWLEMLDDLIRAIYPNDLITFYSGSQEDVAFFNGSGYTIKICDRQEHGLSATKVRQLLLNSDDISKVVDPRIAKEVIEVFNKQLKKYDAMR
jgi:nicotinamide mononucleotide adenylyltransferase